MSVSLIFPPVVETNFGNVFPSTAVLAAYLEAHGICTTQYDFNEDFAHFLLEPGRLRPLTDDVSLPESARVAADWLDRHRDLLFDEENLADLGETSRFGYLLQEVARWFCVDPDSDVIAGEEHRSLDVLTQFFESRVTSALSSDVSLVGISVPMGPQVYPAIVLSRLLKERRPAVRIVVGGPAFSLMEPIDIETFLEAHPCVDAVVRFDGEAPLLALSRMAQDGDWLPHEVPGVSSLRDGQTVHVPPAPGLSVNALPQPLYAPSLLRRVKHPKLGITQARGCYWGKCDYCDFVELYDGSPSFRGRRPDLVAAEMVALHQQTGVADFTLITESIPPAFARRFAAALTAEGLGVTWDSFVMVDRRFDKELFELMVESGCTALVVGMETVNTRVLQIVHKAADREQNLRFLAEAKAAGINLTVNLIPDLPSTTYAEARAALDDLEELRWAIGSVSVYPFEATRSSNIGRNPSDFGLVPSTGSAEPGQAQYALNNLKYEDPAMTRAERAEIHELYRNFATDVNRTQPGADAMRRGPVDTERTLRIPAEILSVADEGGSLVLFDPVTRRRLRFSGRFRAEIEPYLDGRDFTALQVQARLGPERSDLLLERLRGTELVINA